MLDIDHGRLGTRPIVARKAFQEEDLQTLLDPMEDELQRVGASQYYQRTWNSETRWADPRHTMSKS
ncbi:expressed unknown protein [Ectocarpus siliculosus]|uniref:Uncharacterized protein n=1 Tax=Ectocarpus siliculosus TaxID=2880 RepID=D7G177_ECTSI|nr:expressed unknown protein [Ectocarpus siliculosus]|eukprot:CBJ33187.1 expressed unknown protein [Ectocarpus siliculosus]